MFFTMDLCSYSGSLTYSLNTAIFDIVCCFDYTRRPSGRTPVQSFYSRSRGLHLSNKR